MLEPIRIARIIGGLIALQGVVFIAFWRILSMVIATATERYANFSGRMAKALFSQDRALIQLIETGNSFLGPLLIFGIIITILGVLMAVFPKITIKKLIFLRILRIES